MMFDLLVVSDRADACLRGGPEGGEGSRGQPHVHVVPRERYYLLSAQKHRDHPRDQKILVAVRVISTAVTDQPRKSENVI